MSDFKSNLNIVWVFVKHVASVVWKYIKAARMELIVLVGVFAFDLISKSIVENTLAYGATAVVIPNFLNIHRTHNYAAAFGSSFLKDWFGDIGARIFFCVFAVAASVAFFLLLIRNKGKSKWFRVALALFIAGAMGNCMDRMFLGYVRDFIEFEYFGLTIWGRTTWYVFNIADAALVTGVIMVVIYFLFMYKDGSHKKDAVMPELAIDEEQPSLSDPVSAEATESVDGESAEAPDTATASETEAVSEREAADETEQADSDNSDTTGEHEER